MNLKEQFNNKFEEYVIARGFQQGLVPVPVDTILNDFLIYAQTIPATKALIGRALTKKFLKKQSSKTLTQCYYLNKSI